MKSTNAVFALLLAGLLISACSNSDPQTEPEPCSQAWLQSVEAQINSGDGQGHGPDIGSMEWRSVVEFKLGIRGQPQVPPRGSTAWCTYIDQYISR